MDSSSDSFGRSDRASPSPYSRTKRPTSRATPSARCGATDALTDCVGAAEVLPVEFTGTGKKGKIEIEYFDEEDLLRIAGLLLGDS